MRTRSSSKLVGESSPNPTTSNPKRRNHRRSKQPSSLEESPLNTMADQRTIAELLRTPTEGYAEAIVVPPILAEHFELKHSLINMMTSDQFFGLEKDNPHDHIRWFNKITSTIKYKDVPNSAIKLMLFPFFLAGATRRWLKKEPPRSILTWEDLDRYKDLLCACPHHGFTELHQLDTFYNALNPADQDSLNSAAGGNLLERRTQDVLTIIENKSKVRNSRNKSIVSQVKSSDVNSSSSSEIAKLTHAVNQQTSVVTTAMTVILKQFQATPPPASVKAVEEIYVTCGGAHPYYQCLVADGNTFLDNIQGYVSAAAVDYNQGNFGYRPLSVANQIRPPGFAQPDLQNNQNRFSQPQGYNQGNNFNQDTSYQAPIQQNQVVPLSELEKIKKINEVNIKVMQAQINKVKIELRNEMQTSIQASINTIANPKGELKAITTRSGFVLDGPSVPMPLPFINPEEDERAEETLTNPELAEYTIKVPPPLVQKAKPTSLKNYVVYKRDPLHPNILYHSRMHQEKQQEKYEILKSLLSKKEKLLELANTPLNENCSAVILKKFLEKLGDPGKFLIPCGFSELKCKALADLGTSINLMPLSFTFLADFVIVDYESDPRVPLVLGRPFLRIARALIDVHGEEMILCDGDKRLILNMRHDTSNYSNKPKKESISMIDIYNVSHEDYLEDLFANEKITNHQSGNPTFSSHTDLTSPEVINPLSGNPTPISKPVTNSSSSPIITSFEESDLIWEEFEAYLASDSFPPGNDDPVDLLLEEFADELALIIFPPRNDNLPFDIKSDLREIEYLLNHDPTKEMDSILEDSVDEGNLADPNNDLVDTIPEIFTDEHTLDYSSPPLYDDVDDDLVELESDNDDVYDDPFDSKEDKIKESKLLIDELNPPRSSNCLPFPEYDSVLYKDFSEVDVLPSTNNEDKDFNPPLYELPFHKEVSGSETLLSFSSKNEENVFNPGILTSKGVDTSLLLKLSHRGPKAFKVIKIFESLMEIFPCSYG
ncbi:hypothetical protein Tco_1255693 [Tanacetum coccineum]